MAVVMTDMWIGLPWHGVLKGIMGGNKSTKVEFASREQWRLMEIPRILVENRR
jgi:hypothetical protein